MLEFINFLKNLTFSMIAGEDAISFENEVADFDIPGEILTWDDLVFYLRLNCSQAQIATPKTQEQIEKDLLEAEKWEERSRESWIEPLDAEDYLVEAFDLRKKEVVERIDLGDLFRDVAAEAGIIVLDEDKCFDDTVLITEKDWSLVISRVIDKLS